MPTYTYRCKQCGMEFDHFQSIADPPLQTCPSCNGPLERVITGGAGLIFKGSGFYITDYARKNSSGGSKNSEKSSTTEKKGSATNNNSSK